MVIVTSDLHFNHNKEFLWAPRGFSSVEEMNENIISNWNSIVTETDDVYVLGDLMLGGPDAFNSGLELIKRLNGHLHIIIGNHDTDHKIEAYRTLSNVESVEWGGRLKYRGRSFFLSHYPAETACLESDPYTCTINLHGHVHENKKFTFGKPYLYNVALDAHNNKPVSIEEILNDYYKEIKDCEKESR